MKPWGERDLMARTWKNYAYEVVLAAAAYRVMARLPQLDREGLADALLSELRNGPNTANEIRFDSRIWADVVLAADSEETVYTATPLSFGGYTALHRPLTGKEILRLAEQYGREVPDHGYCVIDILPAESAFRRWPRSV